MGSVLPGKAVLIPGININEMILILLIGKYIITYRSIPLSSANRLQKGAIAVTFFFVVVFFSTFYIKHYMFYGLGGVSIEKLFIRLFKLILLFISILLIVVKSDSPSVFLSIKRGLIVGVILYGISVFFSDFFIQQGLAVSTGMDLEKLDRVDYWERRNVGLFSGDSAYLSHYLLVGIGFFLSIYEKRKKTIYILGITILFLAIIYTGSRTGLLVFAIIILVYSIKNFQKNIFGVTAISLVVLLLLSFFGYYLMERILMLQFEAVNLETNRIKFQLYYIKEMIDHPIYFIFGYYQKSSLFRWRIPHNQYLGMVFWGGFGYLSIFLTILYKIFRTDKVLKKSTNSISILYPFIGFVVPYLLNPNEYVIYFPLILSISHNYFVTSNEYSRLISNKYRRVLG